MIGLLASGVFPIREGLTEDGPKSIVIATEEYPPFTSEILKDFGVDAAIVSAAFNYENIKTEFQFYPGARSYKMAQKGVVDATLPWAQRAGREEHFLFSEPVIAVEGEYFYYLKDGSFQWDAGTSPHSQWQGKTIAATIGHNYGAEFQQAEKSGLIKTERLSDLKQGLQMLIFGRVDALISKRHVVTPYLNSYFSSEQRTKLTSVPVSQKPPSFDYLLISKRGKHADYFLQKFNRGLEKLKASGDYQRLMVDLANGMYSKNMHAVK